MLKIRLMRIGTKKKPFYRVVTVDERSKRTGAYIELLGTYNPLTEPKDVKLKQDRIDYWIKQGAQMSDGFLRMIGKAPQRKPRKPKKESKQGTGDSGQQAPKPEETKPAEEATPAPAPAAEKPAETSTKEEPVKETTEKPDAQKVENSAVIPSASEESQDSESTDSSALPQNDKVEKTK